MKKRLVISMTAAAIAAGALAATAMAADYPNNTITLNCGYSAGGSSDVVCRILAEKLTEKLGQTVIVEDVTGSGGWVLWSQMLENTEPDGYTICMVNTPNYNLGAYDPANPRDYVYDDLDLLCNWISDYNALVIRADDDRFSDWDSFIEYWNENPLISSASAVGVMSDDATMIDRLCKQYENEVAMVQTGGASENVTMLLNGSTDFMMCNVSDAATAHIDGEYKILCVFAPERVEGLDDVPTFEELSGVEMIGDSCRGFALPKGVDEEIRETILTALRDSIQDEDTMAKMAEMYTSVNYLEGDDYIALMDNRVDLALEAYDRLADKK